MPGAETNDLMAKHVHTRRFGLLYTYSAVIVVTDCSRQTAIVLAVCVLYSVRNAWLSPPFVPMSTFYTQSSQSVVRWTSIEMTLFVPENIIFFLGGGGGGGGDRLVYRRPDKYRKSRFSLHYLIRTTFC